MARMIDPVWRARIASGIFLTFALSKAALGQSCDIDVTNDRVSINSALSDGTYTLSSPEALSFEVEADEVDHIQVRIQRHEFRGRDPETSQTVWIAPFFWDIHLHVHDDDEIGITNDHVERVFNGVITARNTPLFKIDISEFTDEIAFSVQVIGAFHFTPETFAQFVPGRNSNLRIRAACCGPEGC